MTTYRERNTVIKVVALFAVLGSLLFCLLGLFMAVTFPAMEDVLTTMIPPELHTAALPAIASVAPGMFIVFMGGISIAFLVVGVWLWVGFGIRPTQRITEQRDEDVATLSDFILQSHIAWLTTARALTNWTAIQPFVVSQNRAVLAQLGGMQRGELVQFLAGADLLAGAEGLHLRETDLTDADLSGLNLRGVDFSGSNLTGADVNSADFTNAIITPAQLETTYQQEAT